MRCRSLLLVVCMLVVPLLAMFSHHIPGEARAAVRRAFRETLADVLGKPAEASSPLPPPARSLPAAAGDAPGTHALVPRPDVAAGADATATGLRPIGEPAAEVEVPQQLVAQLADRSRQARGQQSFETRLRDMGAVSFECQPLAGTEGQHGSTCRIPVDASGQLQRVFQASGATPAEATENLIQQVAAWRQRAAVQPASASATDAADAGRSPRLR